jgi:hypothetical protein
MKTSRTRRIAQPLACVTVLALSAFAPMSQAAEAAYDFSVCTHSRTTLIEGSPDLVAFGLESWGVVSTSTTKEWENATTRCAGYIRVMAGKQVGRGVCKWIQATGDTATGEWEYPAAGEPSWRWLVGTGKLKGITGGGTFKALTSAKPAELGTSQGCRRDWGNYTLP